MSSGNHKMFELLSRINEVFVSGSAQQRESIQAHLDDLVHDTAYAVAVDENPHHPDSESEQHETLMAQSAVDASSINNQGVEAQLNYLLQHKTADMIEQYLDLTV